MQKTIVTVVCITSILLLLMFVESNVVDKYCNSFYSNAKSLKKDLENGANTEKDIKKMIDEWEKNKDIIYVFVNHNSFDDIETSLYNAEYHIKNNNLKDALFQSEQLLHRVTELRGGFKFSLGNLL